MKPHPLARPTFFANASRLWASGLVLAMAAARLAASAVPSTETTTIDKELREILRAASIRPALREDLQRPVDPRLNRIETLGLRASGLFTGRRHEARNALEVQALSLQLKPGDQLILKGNDWHDARFVFGGIGTMDEPILVMAEPTTGPFTGASGIAFHGEHLVIMNLTFRNGTVADAVPATSAEEPPATNGPVTGVVANLVRIGAGPDRPANHCIVNRITIENVNSPRAEDWPKAITRYLLLNGHDNTVANSTFAHLKHYGDVIATGELPSSTPQRLHILNNHFFDRPRVDEDPSPYRYKIIQIGWHDLEAAPAGSLVQGNLFEDCASHVELVSIKASDVFLRNNRFIRCPGAVTIRMGDRVLIQNNLFDGEDRPATGGLRVAGRDHVIIGNTFRHLRPTEFSQMLPSPKPPTRYLAWTLSLVAADFEHSGATDSAYGRVCDTLISHNRFEHNTGRIALGTPTPSLSHVALPPHNVRIEHNVFSGYGEDKSPFDYVCPDTQSGTSNASFLTYHNRFFP